MLFGMRIKCKNPFDWHPWFAWRPVPIDNESTWVWWEWIERRVVEAGLGFAVDYRFPKPRNETQNVVPLRE